MDRYYTLLNTSYEELESFNDREAFSWWRGLDDQRGVYFALGTGVEASYKKGE